MEDLKGIKTVMLELIANQSKGSESSYRICDKCGENQYIEITILDQKKIMPRMCKCAKQEYVDQKEQDIRKANQIRLESVIKNSLMDASFKENTFEAWDFSKGDKKMYNMGIRYTEKFQELKKEGVGLMIHGTPGNGKTYLTCCIANRLLESCIPTICVSTIGLLDRIKETYNKWGEEAQADILRSLSRADLLIIDDLGTEPESKWSAPTIYSIIDSRYRSKLPLIITTNLNIDTTKTGGVLADMYGRRTEDRIFEMCTPVLNSQKSIRLEEAKKKTALLNSILKGG